MFVCPPSPNYHALGPFASRDSLAKLIGRKFIVLFSLGQPKVSLSFGPSYAEKGKNITLPVCHVTGFPPPKITWRKVHDHFMQSRAFVKGGQFSIITVQKKKILVCTNAFAVTQLNVIELPYFTVSPPAQFEVNENLTLSISCQADGFPTPTVTWLKGNSQLPSGRSMVSDDGTLTIWGTKKGDSGTYNCVASSGKFFRKAIASMKLTVKGSKVITHLIVTRITKLA